MNGDGTHLSPVAGPRHLVHDLERDLQDALARVPRPGHTIARPLEQALEHARDLRLAFARALDIAIERALARALTHALARTVALAQAHGVDLGLDDALTRAATLSRALAAPEAAASGPPGAAVPRIAAWLIAVESRLLPARHRGRFAVEFAGELHDLACEHGARWPQVLYTLRQLRRVAHLRAALQSPAQPRWFRAACWMLASEWRTWGLFGPVMAFAIVNVHVQQGWGSALFTIPGVVASTRAWNGCANAGAWRSGSARAPARSDPVSPARPGHRR